MTYESEQPRAAADLSEIRELTSSLVAVVDDQATRLKELEAERDSYVNELGAVERLCDEWTEGAAPDVGAEAAVTFVLKSWETTAAERDAAEAHVEALTEALQAYDEVVGLRGARPDDPALKRATRLSRAAFARSIPQASTDVDVATGPPAEETT